MENLRDGVFSGRNGEFLLIFGFLDSTWLQSQFLPVGKRSSVQRRYTCHSQHREIAWLTASKQMTTIKDNKN